MQLPKPWDATIAVLEHARILVVHFVVEIAAVLVQLDVTLNAITLAILPVKVPAKVVVTLHAQVAVEVSNTLAKPTSNPKRTASFRGCPLLDN